MDIRITLLKTHRIRIMLNMPRLVAMGCLAGRGSDSDSDCPASHSDGSVTQELYELLQGEADLFLFVRAMVRLRLPSDPTSRWAPLPSAIRFGATSVRLRLSLQTQGMPGTRRGGGRLAPPPPTCSGAGHLSGPGSGERLVAGRDTDLLRSRRCRPPVPGSAAAS